MSDGVLLVVDDNPADIRFIEEAFSDSALTPTILRSTTREEALDIIYRRNDYADAPDLDVVLLDWNLSRSTGEEVLTAATSVTPTIPVIVMTGTKAEMESMKSNISQAETVVEKSPYPEDYVDHLRPYLISR